MSGLEPKTTYSVRVYVATADRYNIAMPHEYFTTLDPNATPSPTTAAATALPPTESGSTTDSATAQISSHADGTGPTDSQDPRPDNSNQTWFIIAMVAIAAAVFLAGWTLWTRIKAKRTKPPLT